MIYFTLYNRLKFIHLTTSDSNIFPFYGWVISHFIICMYHIFFIQSSIDEYLDRFHVLAIVNSVAVNIGVHLSFRIDFVRVHDP